MAVPLEYIQNLGRVFDGVKFDQFSSCIRVRLAAVPFLPIRKPHTWLADCHGAKDNFDILVCHVLEIYIGSRRGGVWMYCVTLY